MNRAAFFVCTRLVARCQEPALDSRRAKADWEVSWGVERRLQAGRARPEEHEPAKRRRYGWVGVGQGVVLGGTDTRWWLGARGWVTVPGSPRSRRRTSKAV